MSIRKFMLILTSLLALEGCATNLEVTYKSDPPGATLYTNGKSLGYAPVTLNYQVDEKDRQRGWLLLSAPTAKWLSGAEASRADGIRAELRNSLSQEYTFYRPDNFPGREQDVRFGLEVERLQVEKARADQQAWYNLLLQMQLQQQQEQQQRQQRQQQMYIQCLPDGRGGLNCLSY